MEKTFMCYTYSHFNTCGNDDNDDDDDDDELL